MAGNDDQNLAGGNGPPFEDVPIEEPAMEVEAPRRAANA